MFWYLGFFFLHSAARYLLYLQRKMQQKIMVPKSFDKLNGCTGNLIVGERA